jgi:hypothetical protein
MNQFKYKLEPYKGNETRHRCPGCEKERTFTYYIESDTGEHIDPKVGKCNREINCGYHYTPRQFFEDNPEALQIPSKCYNFQKVSNGSKKVNIRKVNYIPESLFIKSLKEYEANYFVKFLIAKFGEKHTSELISLYFIGTSKHWSGSAIMWQIDLSGKVRAGKVMLYDPVKGKRVKEPFPHITWVHKLIDQPDFKLDQCFFGEHLLKDKSKPVAIVESEKTAIIASGYLPKFIWLATGSLSNLTIEKCQVLKGRSIVLFPDINGYERWSLKAKELSSIGLFQVSDLLERNANDLERKQGLDLADYLLRFDPRAFQNCLDSKSHENRQIQVGPEPIDSENNQYGIPAFIDPVGKLFIETPLGKTFTVYPSIEHYNNRHCYPIFQDRNQIDKSILKTVRINLNTLTINNYS